MPDSAYELPFHVEHIIASVHLENDEPNNLAWACPRCNLNKGPNLATIDPDSGEQENLFNPRVDVWGEHFAMQGYVINGLTGKGRGTVRLLKMNQPSRVELRREKMG